MKSDIIEKIIKKTDDLSEMIEIGRKIEAAMPDVYTPLMMEKMFESAEHYFPGSPKEEKDTLVYRSIYDFWAYGCLIDEECYFKFYEKTGAEKSEYLVTRSRVAYINHLNSGGGADRVWFLEDKYNLYKHLKPYYMRDMIEIEEEKDFPVFEEFAEKHTEFVVKPSNYFYGIGVHKVSLADYGGDAKKAFDSILSEGLEIKKRHPSRSTKMVLEELIIQDESMARLHPESVNAIRATAVRGKDGRVHLYHPWIKVGINGTFVASAALDGFDAEIDPETGVVISDGFQEDGSTYKVHPNSGITVKGLQIPRWDELLELVDRIMELLPDYGYVGWDLVLTPKGWCVMEGNYSGEFMFQLINGRGMRSEFEELIGWKYPYEYWWQQKVNDTL